MTLSKIKIGERIIVVDVKGDLDGYIYPYLERLGYEVIRLDFSNPVKTESYNFLQLDQEGLG